jgi:hypothetical protein
MEKTMDFELLSEVKKGGKWLGETRNWLQWNTKNGDSVTWNSDDEIRPPLTVRQVEDLAAHAVAADRTERARQEQTHKESVRILGECLAGSETELAALKEKKG